MKKTAFGSLLNRFRFERDKARINTQDRLWKRNKLDNPARRDGYEMRTEVRKIQDGGETIGVQLWKLIDEETVKVEIDAKVVTIEPEKPDSTLGDLLK